MTSDVVYGSNDDEWRIAECSGPAATGWC